MYKEEASAKAQKKRKKKKWYIVLLLILIFTLLGVGTVLILGGAHWPLFKHKVSSGPKVVLISIDGLRADMLSYSNTPNMAKLADDGVMSPMRPVYPSTTFPNHYSMITGLLPARHGIVGNVFMDPVRGKVFSSRDEKALGDGSWLQEGEPIWNLLERDGGRAAVVHWVGAGTAYSGRRASYSVPFDRSRSSPEITAKLAEFIKMNGTDAPNLVIGYYSMVDSMNHKFGPDSPEEMYALKQVDNEVGKIVGLIGGLKNTNLIIVSDHGAAPVTKRIKLSSLISNYGKRLDFAACSPVTFLYPPPMEVEAILGELKEARGSGFKVYSRDSVPAEWGFRHNPRIPPIIIQSELGVSIDCDQDGTRGRSTGGDHGYDPRHKEMLALFVASGPLFKSSTLSLTSARKGVPLPRTVDVYRVVANCLELPVGPDIDSTPRLENIVMKPLF